MTLKEINSKYKTEKSFITHLEKVLWGNDPVCPYCKSTYQSPKPKEHRYHCNNCNTSFSITTGTLFHKTRVDLRKWAYLIYLILQNENLTVREIGEKIGVTKDTAAFMVRRIKLELPENRNKLEKIIAL